MIHDLIKSIIQILLQLRYGLGQVSLYAPVVKLVSAYLLILQLLECLAQAVYLSLFLFFLKGHVFINVLDSLSLILKHFLHLVEHTSS